MKLKRKSRLFALLIAALCVVSSCILPAGAGAYTTVDTGAKTSLSLQYGRSASPLTGVETHLYRVANMSSTVRFSLSGDFAAYPVDVTKLSDASDWQRAAETLAAYAVADKRSPLASTASDAKGEVSFRSLSTGLYLVTADSRSLNGRTYRFEPFLVTLPQLESKTDTWEYDASVQPKYSSTPNGGPSPSTLQYEVLKRWADSGNEKRRPREITVELYRNAALQKTVTLSEQNSWSYRWTWTDDGSEWTVVERNIADAYTVTVSKQSTAFTVTNSYRTDIPETSPPGGAPSAPPATPTPSVPVTPTPGTSVPPVKLPQTGQLWWPVPLLAVGGLIVFTVGWEIMRRNEEKK